MDPVITVPPIFRWMFAGRLRTIGFRAIAYVTEKCVQRRYPLASGAFAINYAGVGTTPEAFLFHVQQGAYQNGTILISIGLLVQPFKGFDVLIETVVLCVENGLDSELILVGDEYYRSSLQALRDQLRLQQWVIS